MLQITPAERLALQSLAEGRTISQAAALLELRERDVDDLLIALFGRMRVPTPLEAVAAAMRRGLIDGVASAHVSADASA